MAVGKIRLKPVCTAESHRLRNWWDQFPSEVEEELKQRELMEILFEKQLESQGSSHLPASPQQKTGGLYSEKGIPGRSLAWRTLGTLEGRGTSWKTGLGVKYWLLKLLPSSTTTAPGR